MIHLHMIYNVLYNQVQDSNYVGQQPCFVYNHPVWIDDSHNKFYMDDELDAVFLGFDTPVFIFNITNLSSISYQRHYRANMTLLDISNIASGNLSPIAYFALYIRGIAALFAGVWDIFLCFNTAVLIIQHNITRLILLKITNYDNNDINKMHFSWKQIFLYGT